jgi:phage tail sheath protein FI
MPEYLAPGVYVEEVSFRAKSIEGVSTSVAGFIGPTRYGPVGGLPELLTSFPDYERIYGSLDPLAFAGVPQENYMAHAVRGFFDNGGSKLYVTRVYQPPAGGSDGRAALPLAGTSPPITLRARFPGHAGEMRIVFAARLTANLLVVSGGSPPLVQRVSSIQANDVVFIRDSALSSPPNGVAEGLYDVVPLGDGLGLRRPTALTPLPLSALVPGQQVHLVTLTVRVRRPGRFEDEQVWPDLSPHPAHRDALSQLFTPEPPSRLRYLTIPFAIEPADAVSSGAQLVEWLLGATFFQDAFARAPRPAASDLERSYLLDQAHGGSDGSDGALPSPEAYYGEEVDSIKTGLQSFEDVEQIAIVAAPGFSFNYRDNPQRADQIVQHLITHCQVRMRYRVAVLDAGDFQALSEVQDLRGKFDSTHAALYYPWLTILDPLDANGRREIQVPPSGVVAGIYARTDVLHGVFKAPANEVALGAIGLEFLLNKAQQDILNPLGINCFRFFEGRGFRLWGARTISSDPEWKYISVRRYFAYLEHSIDNGTQWAVFENNNERLWANIRQTVSDFLFNEWRNGALLGTKPEEAFFVRCDRSTMTQNDLDNGRLICLIGVAVVKPAEFVIFRIGQFTADHTS